MTHRAAHGHPAAPAPRQRARGAPSGAHPAAARGAARRSCRPAPRRPLTRRAAAKAPGGATKPPFPRDPLTNERLPKSSGMRVCVLKSYSSTCAILDLGQRVSGTEARRLAELAARGTQQRRALPLLVAAIRAMGHKHPDRGVGRPGSPLFSEGRLKQLTEQCKLRKSSITLLYAEAKMLWDEYVCGDDFFEKFKPDMQLVKDVQDVMRAREHDLAPLITLDVLDTLTSSEVPEVAEELELLRGELHAAGYDVGAGDDTYKLKITEAGPSMSIPGRNGAVTPATSIVAAGWSVAQLLPGAMKVPVMHTRAEVADTPHITSAEQCRPSAAPVHAAQLMASFGDVVEGRTRLAGVDWMFVSLRRPASAVEAPPGGAPPDGDGKEATPPAVLVTLESMMLEGDAGTPLDDLRAVASCTARYLSGVVASPDDDELWRRQQDLWVTAEDDAQAGALGLRRNVASDGGAMEGVDRNQSDARHVMRYVTAEGEYSMVALRDEELGGLLDVLTAALMDPGVDLELETAQPAPLRAHRGAAGWLARAAGGWVGSVALGGVVGLVTWALYGTRRAPEGAAASLTARTAARVVEQSRHR
ncbi:unnamed protein product [Pedinophyceae sp. YPF-701]|nr:unnamed protein product [Pedinophyceae sp. YPF-701]